MTFNCIDSLGSCGIAADILAIASSGGHALPVTTGVLVRDTSSVFDWMGLDTDIIESQARTVLEDIDIDIFSLGFMGSAEALAVVAELCADYEDIPVVARVPSVSWWDRDKIEAYFDAFAQLVLPQTSVLVGNYDLLWHWLLPDWRSSKRPSARDIAAAGAQHGVPYVVITSASHQPESLDNVAASPETVLASVSLPRLDAQFLGAGDSFCSTLATLLASGDDLHEAVAQAGSYVHRSLQAAFAPGMGASIADRMFWAQAQAENPEPVTRPH